MVAHHQAQAQAPKVSRALAADSLAAEAEAALSLSRPDRAVVSHLPIPTKYSSK